MQALTQAQRLRRAARLRPHCQYFSRLGWALLTYMGVALAFSLASVPLVHLFPALALSPLFSWCFSVVVSYGFCFPAFCLNPPGDSREPARCPRSAGPCALWAGPAHQHRGAVSDQPAHPASAGCRQFRPGTACERPSGGAVCLSAHPDHPAHLSGLSGASHPHSGRLVPGRPPVGYGYPFQ